MELTKEFIEEILSRTGKRGMHAVGKALVHLKNRQTYDEQHSLITKHSNGRGFMPAHAEIGVKMAEFYEKNGYLSDKQVNYWQGSSPKIKKPRICRYSRQILEEARLKQGDR